MPQQTDIAHRRGQQRLQTGQFRHIGPRRHKKNTVGRSRSRKQTPRGHRVQRRRSGILHQLRIRPQLLQRGDGSRKGGRQYQAGSKGGQTRHGVQHTGRVRLIKIADRQKQQRLPGPYAGPEAAGIGRQGCRLFQQMLRGITQQRPARTLPRRNAFRTGSSRARGRQTCEHTGQIAHSRHLHERVKIDLLPQAFFRLLDNQRETAGTQGKIIAQIHVRPQRGHGPAAGFRQQLQHHLAVRPEIGRGRSRRRKRSRHAASVSGIPAAAARGSDAAKNGARQMPQRIQPGTGLPHAFQLAPLARRRNAHGLRITVQRQAAHGILRSQFQKMGNAVARAHLLHALHPAHGIFIQVRDIFADLPLLPGIEARGDAAQQRYAGRLHFQSVETPQGKIAQHPHAGMMKRQRHIEHDGRNPALAQTLPGLQQHVAGAADNELLRRVVVGNIERGPGSAGLFDDVGPGMHGHHARVPGGAGFQLGHMRGAGIQNVPGHLRRVDARKAQGHELAETVTAHQGGLQPQRGKHAPLSILQQKEIGLLPAGQADFFHVAFVHERKHIPVGHGGDAIHGRAGRGKGVVQFPPHTGPDAALTAAHDGQTGGCGRGSQPDAALGQRLQGLRRRRAPEQRQMLPPERVRAAEVPDVPFMGEIRVAHAVKTDFFGHGPAILRARMQQPAAGRRRSAVQQQRAAPGQTLGPSGHGRPVAGHGQRHAETGPRHGLPPDIRRTFAQPDKGSTAGHETPRGRQTGRHDGVDGDGVQRHRVGRKGGGRKGDASFLHAVLSVAGRATRPEQ